MSTIVTPASLQASITSQSLIEPPGWTTAFMPWRIPTSTPSLNGKKASETIAAPIRPALACAGESIDLLFLLFGALSLLYGKLQVLVGDFVPVETQRIGVLLVGLIDGDFGHPDAVLFARADSDRAFIFDVYYGVGGYALLYEPAKKQVRHFLFGRLLC